MKELGWSWEQLQATPEYVQRYCYDFQQAIWAHEADEAERAEAKRQAQQGAM